jgi:hypothetical protein
LRPLLVIAGAGPGLNRIRTRLRHILLLAILGFGHYIHPRSAKEADMISRILQTVSARSIDVTVTDMPPKNPNDDNEENEEHEEDDDEDEEEPVIRADSGHVEA